MDTADAPQTRPLKVVPKNKRATPPQKPPPYKKPDFVIPYPEDATKGKVDMQGAFRFWKPSDAFEWASRTWTDPNNRMVAYVYRQIPVCNFAQSSQDPNPELGHNISKWESWPFPSSDFHVGMLEKFGAGIYMILWMDPLAGRKIAKVEDWELNNYENYPPKIRVDDVVIDSTKNRSFLAWARNAGCLFPNDKGYEAGKFVHIETQRHRNTNDDEEEYMSKGPIGQALENVTGRILNKAVDNMMEPPPTPAPINPAIASLDHMAAVAAIDIVKDTHNQMAEAKHTEQTALLGLVTTLVNEKSKPDNSQADGFKFAIDAIQRMADMQIAMVTADRNTIAARLERLENRETRLQTVQQAPPVDPQEQFLMYLDRQEAIMQRMGYTRRGGTAAAAEAPEEKDLLQIIKESLPGLIKDGMQMYSTHMQVQVRVAELNAMQRGVPIQQAPPPVATPPPQAQTAPGPPPEVINEAMRKEVGPEFDVYVQNFHGELSKFDRVICAKYTDGLKAIVEDQAETLVDQQDIMADHGALFADWYKQIPGNGHTIMVSYQPILLEVLKTYKPIWDVFGRGPIEMQTAFIAGFCDPSRLDDDEEEETPAEAPN